MTPEQFFSKNMKWIALLLLFLFLLKSVQSCNRNTTLSIKEKQYTHVIDSLKTQNSELQKVNSQLQFDLKLQSEKAGEADKRASAVQSVAEKIRANTTVNVRGAERDTIKTKK